MAKKRYFVTHSAGCIPCDSISRENWDGTFEELTYQEIVDRLNKLTEENIELKKIVNCRNCHYHNYNWFEDGDEFEVCDKGNNEDLDDKGFCKDWREV